MQGGGSEEWCCLPGRGGGARPTLQFEFFKFSQAVDPDTITPFDPHPDPRMNIFF